MPLIPHAPLDQWVGNATAPLISEKPLGMNLNPALEIVRGALWGRGSRGRRRGGVEGGLKPREHIQAPTRHRPTWTDSKAARMSLRSHAPYRQCKASYATNSLVLLGPEEGKKVALRSKTW